MNRKTLTTIEIAQQNLAGAVHRLNAALETATPVESLLILKHVETAALLRSEIEKMAWALRQE